MPPAASHGEDSDAIFNVPLTTVIHTQTDSLRGYSILRENIILWM